jgi:hypothetical protein
MDFDPFANESDSLEISGMTIENREDKVSIYGSIDITRDKKGLEVAKKMAALLNSIVKQLSSEKLPEAIPQPTETDTVKNPFD